MRRFGYWSALLVAAAITAAGCVVALAGSTADGPADAVRAYYAALARADAPAALGAGAVPDGDRAYLTSAVLRDQLHLAPITGLRVTGTQGSGDRRSVQVSYRLGFAADAVDTTDTVPVVREGGAWRLVRTAVTVQPVARGGGLDRFTFAGTAVPHVPVLLFPGAVPVLPDTANLEPVTDGVARFSSAAPVVFVGVQLSSRGRAAVRAALLARLRSCFPAGGTSPTGCPLPTDVHVVPGSLHGTLETQNLDKLVYTLSTDTDGAIRVRGPLTFQGSYQRLDADDLPHAEKGDVDVYVNAVSPATGTPKITFLPGTAP